MIRTSKGQLFIVCNNNLWQAEWVKVCMQGFSA